MMSIKEGILGFILASALFFSEEVFSFAGEEINDMVELETVLVTSSRIPEKLSERTRSTSIITAEEIESMPIHSVPELLNYLAGVDMRQRNLYGVQVDMSIRGSSFEQVLVLIDGINFNDPQTGHHSMDLPLALEDIDRIEILRGNGSSLYGANAFGGVVNIITSKPTRKRPTRVKLSSGSHETCLANFSHTFKLDKFGSRFSFEKEKSDGHRSGTDFDNWGVFSSSTLDLSEGFLDLTWGYREKEFGADKFYGFYPSRERTRTTFGSAKLQYEGMKGINIEPRIYYRKHDDKFVLKRKEPDLYTNDHENLKYGGEVTCYLSLNSWGDMVFGGETGQEEIDSDGIRGGLRAEALGDHRRHNEALYAEYRNIFKNLRINLGTRFDHNSQYGDELSPSLSIGRRISNCLNLRLSLGRSFRAPTFTELYYQDPRKIGNPDLDTESAWSYELGGDYDLKSWIQVSITFFMREEDDLIDWVGLKSQPKQSRIYQVMNISDVRVRGVESQMKMKIGRLANLTGNYTFIYKDAKLDSKFISLYALDYPKHIFSFHINQSLPYKIKGVLGGVYKKRIKDGGYFMLNMRLSKKTGFLSMYIDCTNLLNKQYEDLLGARMPGTWIMLGLSLSKFL